MDIPALFSLNGQVAAITGAGSGIGAATAEVLATAGAAVALGDIDAEGAEATAKKLTGAGMRAVAQRTDVSSRADVDALVDRAVSEYGRLDIMANVAGIGHGKPIAETTEEDFDHLMAVNLKGVLFGCQAALKVMVPQKSGSIVNVASTVIDYRSPGFGLYGMTKAGVTFLSEVLAEEAGAYGIRVNVLAPGSTPTNFASFRYPDGKVDAEKEKPIWEARADVTPLRFIGDAFDQAMMILFLVSPAARWVSGNVYRVNGGQSRVW